ncbi:MULTISPECIES: hypothetical protein [Halorussus]|uniref:hypothetical protein n=1 Tax=Halorussus TaxID=1070314 RepID=UPI00209CBBD1|nr:hypothetical protein [Halorussus vallis]USZ76158.1 hypothetical protein NGM07_02255 [Halorussus vallis]
MGLERILAMGTTLALAGTLPLALVASRGFSGAPFGSVLRPLPVVLGAFLALNANEVLGTETPPAYELVVSLVAICGILVSAAHVLVLLTERRKL